MDTSYGKSFATLMLTLGVAATCLMLSSFTVPYSLVAANANDSTAIDGNFTWDTARYAIIKYDPQNYSPYLTASPAKLSREEVSDIGKALNDAVIDFNKNKAVDNYNHQDTKNYVKLEIVHFTIDLRNYYIQIVPVYNNSGEREVWINATCQITKKSKKDGSWRKEIFMGGNIGSCMFNLRMKMETFEIVSFNVEKMLIPTHPPPGSTMPRPDNWHPKY